MKRNVSLEEISDGRLYGENDMVKADCHGCKGCAACCTGMGTSVILDPYDIYRFQKGMKKPLSYLIANDAVELNVVDGAILPNLKMVGEQEKCTFLSEEGRCGIHENRPGVCRLFPLGRFYEDGDFRYFLQAGECKASNRSKVKVSKWIDIPDRNRNHDFLCKWHEVLKQVEAAVGENGEEMDLEVGRQINMLLLKTFFLEPYVMEEDFYGQFEARMEAFRENFNTLICGHG